MNRIFSFCLLVLVVLSTESCNNFTDYSVLPQIAAYCECTVQIKHDQTIDSHLYGKVKGTRISLSYNEKIDEDLKILVTGNAAIRHYQNLIDKTDFYSMEVVIIENIDGEENKSTSEYSNVLLDLISLKERALHIAGNHVKNTNYAELYEEFHPDIYSTMDTVGVTSLFLNLDKEFGRVTTTELGSFSISAEMIDDEIVEYVHLYGTQQREFSDEFFYFNAVLNTDPNSTYLYGLNF